MLTDGQKIQQLRTAEGLTQEQFANKLGVSKSLIVALENSGRTLSLKMLHRIQEVFQTDLYSTIHQNNKHTELIQLRKSHNLSQTQLAEILDCPQSLVAMIENGKRKAPQWFKEAVLNHFSFVLSDVPKEENELAKLPENIISIPFYSAKASAGTGEALPDYPEKDVMWFDSRWLKNILGLNNPSNLAILQAKGDSMDGGNYPIKDGDFLLVDESYKEPIHNQVFVINLGNNDLVVKRINRDWNGQLTLISNNTAYEPISPSPEATIIGKVVWNSSKENV